MASTHCSCGKKRFSLCSLALLFALLLPGCGVVRYAVTVDSLRDEELAQGKTVYCLVPGNDEVARDKLLFDEVCQMLSPAFRARGFTVLPQCEGARNTVRITYWEGAPRESLESENVRVTKPVTMWDGTKEYVKYIHTNESAVVVHTYYTAHLVLAAFTRTGAGEEKQIWRTSITSSGETGNLRTRIAPMIPALKKSLGIRTSGDQIFEVLVDDNGNMSMSEKN